jgi:flagellar biosynthesis protein FlgN
LSERSQHAPTPLQHLLLEEAGQLRGFLVLLEQEQQALADGDIDRLMPLAAEKGALFAQLSRLGEARAVALASDGFTADKKGMADWLRAHPELADARKAWAALLDLAGKANALNLTNGKLIATRLAHNQQALSALLAAANQGELYGPDGQAHPVGGGRSLGSV